MVVFISGGLKNQICTFRHSEWKMHATTRSPQPSKAQRKPSTKYISNWHPRAGEPSSNCSKWHTSCDALYLQATKFRWVSLAYLEKNINTNQHQQFFPEQHNTPGTSPFILYCFFPLPTTSSSFSLPHYLPRSHFSSHHPLPHLQCRLCQLWLAFFGFSKKISPGIVLHSLFDRKAVPELTHEAGVLLEISYPTGSDSDNWEQLGECSFIHWSPEQQKNIFVISSPFTLSLVAIIGVLFQSDRNSSKAVTYSQVLQVFTKLLWISIEVWSLWVNV